MAATSANSAATRAGDGIGPVTRYCVRHPGRETLVSCGRCGRPFCPDCLIHTPAGQRCYDCAGVRRAALRTAATTGIVKGFGIVVIGAVIGSMFGLMGLLIGAVAGDFAGRAVSPSVNRHTRRLLYPLCFVLLLVGTALGWTLPLLFRLLTASHGALGGNEIALLLFLIPTALAHNLSYWLFVALAAAVGYQRVR